MLKKALTFIIIFSIIFQSSAFANLESENDNKIEDYESRKCGNISVVTDELSNDPSIMRVCREDAGLLDFEYKTKKAKTKIYAPLSLVKGFDSAKDIVDEFLLAEIKKKAEVRLEGLKIIDQLPSSKENNELKKNATELREFVLNNDKKAIHQIRILLSVYPDIEDELIAENPNFKPLVCRYEVWKHRKSTLLKVTRIASKIMTKILMISSITSLGAGYLGFLALDNIGPIFIALGATEFGVGGLQMFGTLSNWDDVRSGRIAHKILKLNDDLKSELKDLQKDPEKNEEKIKLLQSILTSTEKEINIDELKKLTKEKNKRIKEIIGSVYRMGLGLLTVKTGLEFDKRFKDFKADSPAEVTGQPQTVSDPNTAPYVPDSSTSANSALESTPVDTTTGTNFTGVDNGRLGL